MKVKIKSSGVVIITPEENEEIKQILVYTTNNVSVSRDKLDRIHISVKP